MWLFQFHLFDCCHCSCSCCRDFLNFNGKDKKKELNKAKKAKKQKLAIGNCSLLCFYAYLSVAYAATRKSNDCCKCKIMQLLCFFLNISTNFTQSTFIRVSTAFNRLFLFYFFASNFNCIANAQPLA